MRAVRTRRGPLALALGAVGCAALIASATPASAHVSFSSAPTFGFAPNTSGGTGLNGTAPPYVPGSTQKVFLRAPNEETNQVNGSDNTTVDVQITVPAGFTDPVCGQARKNLKDDTTNQTNQPGAVVSGWSCAIETVAAHSVLHFSGPQVVAPVGIADSAQYFSFDITVPAPATQTTYNGLNGTEGFIVDQMYAGNEMVHWIPSGTDSGNTKVAAGLARTVGGPGTAFHPVSPTRILDSRTGNGWSGKLGAGTPRELTVTAGAASVPATVDAVVLNVTATDSNADSFLTVYPNADPLPAPPTASNVNFATGQTIPNLVTVKVGKDGKILFNNNTGSTDVIGDLVGYYDDAATDLFNPLPPARILDSRTTTGGFNGPLVAGTAKSLHVHDGGVAETATAVVLNVTVTGSTKNAFLTVYPTGVTPPNASNLNFATGQTIANLVTVPVGTDGYVDFRTTDGQVNVIADVVGYFDPAQGDLFISVPPGRILDSRTTNGGWNSKLAAGTDRDLQVQGYGGVRFDATSVLANATVTNGTQNSYLTAYPAGQARPGVSNLNFAVGQTIPNLTSVKLGDGGKIRFNNNQGATDVIYDVVGFYAPPPPGS